MNLKKPNGPRYIPAPISPENIADLPSEVLCEGCRAPLATVTKDATHKRVAIQIHFTKPPQVLSRAERLGLARCDACGANTPFDLLLLGSR